jgi:acid phosphatase type 7
MSAATTRSNARERPSVVGAGFRRLRIWCWLQPAPTIGILFVLLLLLAASPATAQQEPFITHDTKPVVMHGPWISSMTETSATIVWVTDTPCHAEVAYGTAEPLTAKADNAVDGLLPVGLVHAVTVNGLDPGTRYTYRAVSTRVVKMKAYWPEKGLAVETPAAAFTTFDRRKAAVSFTAITDTHEDNARVTALLKLVDPAANDFLVHLGDAFNSVESEDQLFGRWFDPAAKLAAGSLPLLYVRGNHELRGAFARSLADYVPAPEGRYYFARDAGPLHLVVLDTGEDKPDDTNVYARLNRVGPYRTAELAWLKTHAADPRAAAAPFRVVLAHHPGWGWSVEQAPAWTAAANAAKVDLVMGGHFHRTLITKPGQAGNDFYVVALGQDAAARVTATAAELTVTIVDKAGAVTNTLVIPVKPR